MFEEYDDDILSSLARPNGFFNNESLFYSMKTYNEPTPYQLNALNLIVGNGRTFSLHYERIITFEENKLQLNPFYIF